MKRFDGVYPVPMKAKLALLSLSAACLLLGSDYGKEYVTISNTQKLDFPAGGTLRLEHSTGEVTIEASDDPGFEMTTTAQSLEGYLPADREKEKQQLEGIKITAKRDGNDVVVTTDYPRHRAFPWIEPLTVVTNYYLNYKIRVPRNTKLVIHHDDGEVNIDEISGNVDATARQGLIELRVIAENMPPMIDAKSFTGTVNSDFDGKETGQKLHFGHTFTEGAGSAPQKLNLKIGYGDIVILKAHEPKEPPPAT